MSGFDREKFEAAMYGLRRELEKMRREHFDQWLRYYDPVAYVAYRRARRHERRLAGWPD